MTYFEASLWEVNTTGKVSMQKWRKEGTSVYWPLWHFWRYFQIAAAVTFTWLSNTRYRRRSLTWIYCHRALGNMNTRFMPHRKSSTEMWIVMALSIAFGYNPGSNLLSSSNFLLIASSLWRSRLIPHVQFCCHLRPFICDGIWGWPPSATFEENLTKAVCRKGNSLRKPRMKGLRKGAGIRRKIGRILGKPGRCFWSQLPSRTSMHVIESCDFFG